MAEIKDYSVTADDNNSASPNGMPENMAPSGVNNSWRESFARVKRWYEDINATKSTTGSSNAYVLTAARTVTAYAQGDAYMFRANHANTGAATLNIDSVGAVEIVNNTQSALAAGQIQSGGIYLVAYDATNSKFQLVGASATSASGDNIFVFNASPSVTLSNSTAEDSDGGRESTIQWKGLQSGSEESTLVKIIGSHDGSSDDQKGKLQIYTNDGSDGDSPTLQVTIDSAGLCTLVGAASIGGSLTVAGATQLNSTVTVGANDQGYDVILYGDTASANVTWDTSVDDLILNGAAGLIVPDGQLTLGSTAVTSTGAELNYNDTGAAVGTVVASKTVTVDANKDVSSFRNITLTGELDAGSLDVSGNADIDGTLEADAMTLNGTAITTTATLSTGISDGNVPVFTSGVADDDFLRVAGTSIEGRSAAEVLSDIGASPVAGSSSIVTTGALDAGSITSGFGAIDNGSSAITTTGVITGGTVEATTDTAAGDNAAIGYTAAEGLILTGQGSTSDVTIKNDADATVLSIPTGTTQVGIGTTTPSAELGFPIGNDVEISQVAVTAHQAGNAGHIGLTIADGGGHAGFFVNNTHDGTYSDTHLSFKTGEGNVSVATERMRITPNGNVGIGTTSPTGKLTVSSDIDVLGSNFANVEFTGASVNGSGVYTGLDSGGGYVVNVRDSGYIGFSTTNAERMRIDSSGNVGIGTSSPSSYTSDTLVISSGDQGGMTLVSANNVENYISWADGTSGAAQLQAGFIGYNHASNYMRFGTTATERMRMLSDGQLIVAGTSFNANGSVCIGPIGTSSNGCTAVSASALATNMWRFYNPNGHIGSISVSGSTCNFTSHSDYRLKENVNYTFDATTRLKQLKPARFNFISDPDVTVDGFIAHEAQEVVPHAVTGEKDGEEMQGIDQSKLVPLLVKTIQELEARITALEAE